MSSVLNQRDLGVKRVEWFELFGRIAITAAGYPFEYVKVLIQIGHEPLPPRETHTILGRPALALPGVWTYMKHIKKIDGFFGLYRGLTPKLCTNLIQGFTYTIILDRLPSLDRVNEGCEDLEEELTDQQKILRFVHRLLQETIAKCASILASHPLKVISIRTIAQFVGRETKYCGIYASVKEVYGQDGISGYFSGIVPRIIGEVLTLWLASTITFCINTYIIEEKAIRGYARTTANYFANTLFYPFVVVSTCVSVNNSGLIAGQPPNMPVYESWADCWSHLSAIGQLKRGSSILWRYYHGPLLRPYEKPLKRL